MKLLSTLLIAVVAYGQQAGDIKTTGACSPVTNGNNNVYTITCGIGEAQGKKLLNIANQILANEAKLDDIKTLVEDLRKDLAVRPAVQIGTMNVQPGGAVSVNQTGGATIGTLNINQKKPARHIPENIQAAMVTELAKTPGEFSVGSFVGDTEAYALAMEFQDIFTKAKWTSKRIGYISSFTMGGKPWTGIHADFPMVGSVGEPVILNGWRAGADRTLEAVTKFLKLEFQSNVPVNAQDLELQIRVGPQAQ